MGIVLCNLFSYILYSKVVNTVLPFVSFRFVMARIKAFDDIT